MKRSHSIALVMMGASTIALTACEDSRVDAAIYKNWIECSNAPGSNHAQCKEEYKIAKEEHAVVAPKYADKAACEAEFGLGNCETAADPSGGRRSVFMPLMMGYMMGKMVGGPGGVFTQPLYRSAGDPNTYRTADDRSVGKTTGRTTVSKAAAGRPTAKANTVARGGFGSGARSYGSASS